MLGAFRGQTEIVGDEQHRGSQGIGQHVQMVEDLLLHGHVKRGGRLVGDEQFRTAGQTDGDQRTLTAFLGIHVLVGDIGA